MIRRMEAAVVPGGTSSPTSDFDPPVGGGGGLTFLELLAAVAGVDLRPSSRSRESSRVRLLRDILRVELELEHVELDEHACYRLTARFALEYGEALRSIRLG